MKKLITKDGYIELDNKEIYQEGYVKYDKSNLYCNGNGDNSGGNKL